MQQLDGREVKKKIGEFLENHGPSLPVQVARYMQMNTLFIGAFLSEMASDKTIKISHMKIGGSPLYYTVSKKDMLENFNKFLNSKEKEAQVLLKERQILQDSQQTPAIRVALRGLKDFAYPFKFNESLLWRYFNLSEEEAILKIKEKLLEHEETKNKIEIKKEINPSAELEAIKQELLEKKKELESMIQKIEGKKKQEQEPQEKLKEVEKINPQAKNRKKLKKSNEKEDFLNEIKDYLIKKGLNLKKVESYDKKQVIALVISEGKEYLLGAFNKKKTEESDILKTYKKAQILALPYIVVSKGEAPKKAKEIIEAYKKLVSLEKIEQTASLEKQ